jgi:hypothetical protein
MFVCGILLLGHFTYMYKKLSPAFKILNFITWLLCMISSMTFALISIFPEYPVGIMHGTVSNSAFYGFGGSLVFLFFVFLRKRAITKTWPKTIHLIIVYGVIAIIMILMFLFTKQTGLFSSLDLVGNGGLFDFNKFWEYILLLTILWWFIGSFAMTQ